MTVIEIQPKRGEILAHCGHLRKKYHHWSRDLGGGFMETATGDIIESKWILECKSCYNKRQKSGQLSIRGFGVWQSDEPVILEG